MDLLLLFAELYHKLQKIKTRTTISGIIFVFLTVIPEMFNYVSVLPRDTPLERQTVASNHCSEGILTVKVSCGLKVSSNKVSLSCYDVSLKLNFRSGKT